MNEKKKLAISIFHSVASKYIIYIAQFLTIIIVARLYTPSQLGYFAILQLLLAFFTVLTNSGLGNAIVNEGVLSKDESGGLFSFTVILGFLLSFFSYLATPTVERFYNGVAFEGFIWICFSIFIQAILILPNAFLIKDKLFYKLGVSTSIAELLSLSYLLINYFIMSRNGVEVLAEKVFVFTFLKFVFIYYFSSYSSNGAVRIGKRVGVMKKYLAFSSYQLGFSFINFFTRNLDNILIGKYFGVQALGFYDRAYQLMRYPLQLITFSLVPAIQPNIVEIKKMASIVNVHNWLIRVLSLISIFICFFLASASEAIVIFLFGEKWLPSAQVLFVFSFMIPSQILMSSSGGFFQACGKVNVLFWSGMISAVTNVLSIAIGIYLGGIFYVALLLLLSFSINLFQTYYCLYKYVFEVSFKNFLVSLKPSMFMAGTLLVPFYFLNNIEMNGVLFIVFCFFVYLILSIPVFYLYRDELMK